MVHYKPLRSSVANGFKHKKKNQITLTFMHLQQVPKFLTITLIKTKVTIISRTTNRLIASSKLITKCEISMHQVPPIWVYIGEDFFAFSSGLIVLSNHKFTKTYSLKNQKFIESVIQVLSNWLSLFLFTMLCNMINKLQ